MLTETKKNNLLKAIDLAQGHLKCEYVVDEKPHCVIAQLFCLEGGSIEQMKTWVNTLGYSASISSVTWENKKQLCDYPESLLNQIQKIWDTDDYHSEADCRNLMKVAVEGWREKSNGR